MPHPNSGSSDRLNPKTHSLGPPFLDAIELEPRILYSASPVAFASEFIGNDDGGFGGIETSYQDDSELGENPPPELTLANEVAGDLEAFDDLLHRLEDHDQGEGSERLVQLVFIDTGVNQWESLVAELDQSSNSIEVVVLDRNRSGIEQVTESLTGREGLAAIHLVSHGNTDQLMLGGSVLTADTVGEHADSLASWQAALSDDADLLIYGCQLGASDSGRALLNSMSALCDCDVAASDDVTGHTELGGDWLLEYEVGQIETASLFTSSIDDSFLGTLATYTVTTADGGSAVGTLRWAVEQANSDSGADRIEFNIAGGGVHRITVDSKVTITESVVLDATTQASFAIGAPTIEIDGSAIGGDLLELHGDNITVTGLSLINADHDAIEIEGLNVTVFGNLIGLDAAGEIASNRTGINIKNDNATIGGLAAGERNVVSGNLDQGILIRDNASDVNVHGNYVGVGVDGTSDRGNFGEGIRIQNNAIDVAIGGIGLGQGNIIAFNDGAGVEVVSPEYRNPIRGNAIYSNSGIAVDLAADGVTANDLTTPFADNDNGPNRLQNFPVIDLADYDGTTLSVEGDLSGRSFVFYTIDFYATSVVHSTGHGDAQRYLGSQTFLTDFDGQIRFSSALTTTVLPGEFLTAAVVHSDGSSSELSQAFAIGISNNAPDLDDTSELVHVINMNNVNDSGLTIAQWMATGGTDPITDADGDPEGIAIVSLSDGNGQWEASLDGGSTWVPLNFALPVSESSAILLDETTRLRYVPDVGYAGDSGELRFRAWDQTDGRANGAIFVDTTPGGGASPFSLATETLLTRIVDPIVAADDVFSTQENQTLNAGNVLDNDSFVGAGPGVLRVDNFDSVSAFGATVSISNNGDLVYSPGSQFDSLQEGEFIDDTLTYTVGDGLGNQRQATVQVRVNGNNDAPVFGDQNFSLSEVESNGYVLGTLAATDADQGPSGDLTFSVIGGSGQSVFMVSPSGQLSLIDEAMLDFDLNDRFMLDVEVVDNGVTPSSATAQIQIQVVDENAAPQIQLVNTVSSIAEDLDTRSRSKIADIVISDDVAGVNEVALAGPDAALFEIFNRELFLREGVVLDFESAAVLEVMVIVDDLTLGSTPEDSASLLLNIDDVTEEVLFVNAIGLETNEAGGIAEFEILLSAPPTSSVVITFISSDLAEGQLLVSSVTFGPNNWRTPQVVTVEGQADLVPDGNVTFGIALTTTSADPSFNTLAIPVVPVVNRGSIFAPPPSTSESSSEESNEEDSSDDVSAEEAIGGVINVRGAAAVERATSSTAARAMGGDVAGPTKSTNQTEESAEQELIKLDSENNYRRQVRRSTERFEPASMTLTSNMMDTVEIESVLSRDFFDDLDHLRDQMAADANLPSIVVGSVASMASALTVGYVTWLVRGGQLLIGVLGQLPIWRFVDPLPILSEMAEDDDLEDQSLANMVDEADDQNRDVDALNSVSTLTSSTETNETSWNETSWNEREPS